MRTLSIGIFVLGVALWAVGCSKGGDASAPAASGASATSGGASAAAGGAFALPADLDQGPRANSEAIDAAQAEAGEKLFQSRGCSACHAFGKRVTCPDLAGVTERRTAKWIRTQILHPDVMTKQDPTARQLYAQFALQMPKQGLTEAEAQAVLEFLKHKNHEAGDKH